MSRIIFPRNSDGTLLLTSLFESLHLTNSASRSEFFTYAFLRGRGFFVSYSFCLYCLNNDFSRFFFWNSSRLSFFLLGILVIPCIILHIVNSSTYDKRKYVFNTSYILIIIQFSRWDICDNNLIEILFLNTF